MATLWLSDKPCVRAAVVTITEGWFQHQQLPAGSILSSQVAWHDTLLGDQDLHGWPAVAELGQWLTTAVPNLRIKVETVVSADHHHVLLYYTAGGEHMGPLTHSLGYPPSSDTASSADAMAQIAASGKAVAWTGSMVVRLQPANIISTQSAAGADAGMQVVEVWHAWDVLFLLQQTGHAPSCVPKAPAAAPAATEADENPPLYGGLDFAGSQSDECKAVVQEYFDTYNSGEFSRLPVIVHPSYHYWGLIDLGEQRGVAAMQAMMAGWRDALSDFSIHCDWMVAGEGNRVLFKWVVKGLHTKGPLRGVAADPRGARRITAWGITALSITESCGGQLGQIWRKVSHANGAELLRQLGMCSFRVSC